MRLKLFRYIILLSFVVFQPGCITPGRTFEDVKNDFFDGIRSEEIRKEKTYFLGVTGGGPKTHGLSGLSYVFGYYLDPNAILEIDIGSGEDGEDVNSQKGQPYYSKTLTGSVSYKHFFLNSFFIKGSVGYRETNVNFTRMSLLGYHYKGHRGEATLGLGNQWQWEHMAFGVEYLAVAVPFSASYSEEGIFSTAGESDLASEKDKFSHGTQTYLQLYWGMSF